LSEERKTDKAEIGGGSARAAVLKIDPLIAEENLFQKLSKQVESDSSIRKVLEELKSVQSGPARTAAIVHMMMRHNVSTLLGHIIPPQSGSKIIKDRIVQAATILLEMLREEVEKLEKEITQSIREGKDFEVGRNVKKMIQLHLDVLIAIREIMNRYIVLYSLNLPPEYRPPLAQVKLGVEVIST